MGLRNGFVSSLLRQATSSAVAIRGEASKVLDLVVNSGDPELLTAALDSDLTKGLEIMGQTVSNVMLGLKVSFTKNSASS